MEEKPKTKRRTKEEIEFDKLAQELVEAKESNNEEALKEVKKKLKNQPSICGAVITASNKFCRETPEEGKSRCEKHLNSQNQQYLEPLAPFKHGLRSSNFMAHLTEDEKAFYVGTMQDYAEKYELDQLNLMALDRMIVSFLKAKRLEDFHAGQGTFETPHSTVDFDLRAQRWLETLGLNRKNTVKNDIDTTRGNSIAFLMMDEE